MRQRLRHLLVLLALIISYLLIFPIPAGEELVIQRAWSVGAESAPVVSGSRTPDAALVPVAFLDSFSYLTEAGAVIHRGPIAYGVALGERGYISFGRDPDQLVLQDTDGSFLATIPQSGYPQFSGDGLFVRSGGDTIVTAYSPVGDPRWRQQLGGPVSSIRADGGLSVLGLLSGGIVVVDDSGESIGVEGIDNPYLLTVYGSDIHGPSGSVAVVYGPADPALFLYQLRAGRLVPSLRVDLHESPGTSIAVAVTADGQQVIFDDHGVRIVQVVSGAQSSVAARYPLRQIETASGSGLVTTLGVGKERDPQHGFKFPAELIIFDHDGVSPVRIPFGADRVSLTAVNGSNYLSLDNRVLKFTVGVE